MFSLYSPLTCTDFFSSSESNSSLNFPGMLCISSSSTSAIGFRVVSAVLEQPQLGLADWQLHWSHFTASWSFHSFIPTRIAVTSSRLMPRRPIFSLSCGLRFSLMLVRRLDVFSFLFNLRSTSSLEGRSMVGDADSSFSRHGDVFADVVSGFSLDCSPGCRSMCSNKSDSGHPAWSCSTLKFSFFVYRREKRRISGSYSCEQEKESEH
jgi:hypothetical protein